MRLSLIIVLIFSFLIVNALTIYDTNEVLPIWNEQCAFSDNEEECTLSSLQEFIFDFEYKGKRLEGLGTKKTYIRFYVELDCTVSGVEVLRSCGDENYDKHIVKYMSTLPDFYTSGFTGRKEQRFPFVVPFRYEDAFN